jgi:hypothetical protein
VRVCEANASKHKATSYARMEETEKWLQEGVRELLKRAEAVGEIDFRNSSRDEFIERDKLSFCTRQGQYGRSMV